MNPEHHQSIASRNLLVHPDPITDDEFIAGNESPSKKQNELNITKEGIFCKKILEVLNDIETNDNQDKASDYVDKVFELIDKEVEASITLVTDIKNSVMPLVLLKTDAEIEDKLKIIRSGLDKTKEICQAPIQHTICVTPLLDSTH